MTLPRLYAMNDYWEKAPPVHVSLAVLNKALLVKKEGGSKDSSSEPKTFEDFIREFTAQGGNIEVQGGK